jgi:hypothetical protein
MVRGGAQPVAAAVGAEGEEVEDDQSAAGLSCSCWHC